MMRQPSFLRMLRYLLTTCIVSVLVLLILLNHREGGTDISVAGGGITRMRYDNSRQSVIEDWAVVGEWWQRWTSRANISGEHRGVCLATHASLNKLHHVIDVSRTWQGLISVAVFVPEPSYHIATAYVRLLQRCFTAVMSNVTIHWVFPVTLLSPNEKPISSNEAFFDDVHCRLWKEEGLLTKLAFARNVTYPQNLMRNVARKNCVMDYVLMIDVDLVPSQNLGPSLDAFVHSNLTCDKCVYVLPAYEMKREANDSVPHTKRQLLELVRSGKARPYRSVAYKPNQQSTNATLWEALPDTGSAVPSVAYQLPKFRFDYEPFYLSRDDVPSHDERFVGYGYTRNTQVFETLTAGYSFFVLDNVFLVHSGMDTNPYSSSKKRKKEVFQNLTKYYVFLREIAIRYAKRKTTSNNDRTNNLLKD